MPADAAFKQAIQAIKSGDKALAQKLLGQALAADPQDDRAWLLLAGCVSDASKKRYCLQKALAIRPNNREALRALEILESDARAAADQDRPTVPGQETARKKAPGRKRARFSAWQCGSLIFLGLIALVAVAGAGFMLLQSGLLPYPLAALPATQPAAPLQATPAGVRQFPPTWTWTPQAPVTPSPPPTRLPTATLVTPTPIPSITSLFSRWKFVIGYSVANRPIEVYQFGAGRKERLLVAGIHGGDEWNTIALADELIAHLQQNPEVVPAGVTLYILRSLNPDGEARGRSPDGRTNERGVDLNRNWAANWAADWERDNCWNERPTTSGAYPNSEPETQALAKFLLARKVEVLISYHSAGLGIFPSGDPPDPTSVRLAQDIAAISGYAYPPAATGCKYTGTLADWALQHGIVAVDLELPTGNQTDFATNLKILDLLLTWEPPIEATPTEAPTTPATGEATETPSPTPSGTP
ncbi:MAG: hypothetical protein JXA78_14195 [Anaerolineales bacterium]|nr:hypothetical protein [Anaerolineales bacterium]